MDLRGVLRESSGRFVACWLAAWTLAGGVPPSEGNDAANFEDAVAPLLEARCVTCHSDVARKGKLALDTRDGILKALDLASPDRSRLLEAVTGPTPEMPKDGEPLSPGEVRLLRDWIAAGAPWPEGRVLHETTELPDRDWWSLKPVRRPDPPELPPATPGAERVRNPIDRFIVARHRELGLTMALEADRRVLIRRLFFDLIGLPPTPEEVEAFVADPDPAAHEKLVDRLLASPHYGERWARHWLDVVHYGDTHGYDKDKLRPNAYPYRDYVIRSLNEDKPYSRFVREQLAGDVLWPDTVDGIVATGFIAAGPWDFIGHAEVPEEKYDGQVARHLDRDDMVTSTMNAFCSLTAQCAQCHDHKRDPVSMEDYYSLQAVFAAIDRADRPYDVDPNVARERKRLRGELAAAEETLADVRRRIEGRVTPELAALEKRIAEREQRPAGGEAGDPAERSPAYGYHSEVADRNDVGKWVQVDLGEIVAIDDVVLAGANEYGWADFGFPHRFRVEASIDASFRSPTVLTDHTAEDFARPGARPVRIAGGGAEGRFVRVTATKLWNRRRAGEAESGDWIFALGELAVLSGGRIVPAAAVSALDSIEAGQRWSKAALVDGVFGANRLDALAAAGDASPGNGYHSAFSDRADDPKWVQVGLDAVAEFDRIELVPARPTDFPDTPGFGFPHRFRIEASDDPEFKSARIVVDQGDEDFANPGGDAVSFPLQASGRFVRLTATRTWDRPGGGGHLLALSELRVFRGDDEISRGREVTALDSIDAGRWHRRFLTDGFSSRGQLRSDAELLLSWVEIEDDGGEADQGVEAARAERDRLRMAVIGDALLAEESTQADRVNGLKSALDALPAPLMVYAGTVHHGSGAFIGRGHVGGRPREIFLLSRGNLRQPVARMGPGVPDVVPGAPARFDLTDDEPEGLRRVALADWIVHPDNPLTWRSIVNRVWQYHFGAGIVNTANDFGRLGELPTHPDLLDWLAAEFRDNGESLKHLHRLICNSATYRQGAEDDPANAAIDSANQFLWRMNRRRLEAEAVRDAILDVSGKLDRTMFGPGYQDFIIEKPEHSPHYEYEKYDPDDPATHRRAIYRFIVRSQPQPWMNALDCADPSQSVARRDETLTALQALAVLNNRFVVRMAEHFASRIEGEVGTDPRALASLAFTLALGRPPDPEEVDPLADYAKAHGSAALCRVIFNLNEFAFVD